MKHANSKIIAHLDKAGVFCVGEQEVTKILLCRDGAGPMGWYDRIHVFWGDDENPGKTMPAHLVDKWG